MLATKRLMTNAFLWCRPRDCLWPTFFFLFFIKKKNLRFAGSKTLWKLFINNLVQFPNHSMLRTTTKFTCAKLHIFSLPSKIKANRFKTFSSYCKVFLLFPTAFSGQLDATSLMHLHHRAASSTPHFSLISVKNIV